MLIGGHPGGAGVEIVELGNSPISICPDPPNTPIHLDGLAATFINEQPMACGGYGNVKCFTYSFASKAWTNNANLDLARGMVMGVMVDESTWWIVGGEPMTYTTEIFSGGTMSTGPILPRPASMACLLKLNATHFFLAGGKGTSNGDTVNSAHIMDWTTKTWTNLPGMQELRRSPHCHYLDGEVFVAGGRGSSNAATTTEIFSQSTQTWRYGQKMPNTLEEICCGSLTVGNEAGSLYMFGGYVRNVRVDDVYKFDQEKKEWTLLSKKLKIGRNAHAVIKLPDDFC